MDILSANYNICARVAGGSNAGHTIVVGDKTFKFHLLPSGMLHPGTMGVIGNGVVVHIPTLLKEMKVCGVLCISGVEVSVGSVVRGVLGRRRMSEAESEGACACPLDTLTEVSA